MRSRLRARLSAALALVAVAAGCGEKGPPPGAPLGTPTPVRGKVTLPGGTPLKGGIVEFYPVEGAVGGQLRFEGGGLVDGKGDFVAGRANDKGLVPGEYVVTVAPRDVSELAGSNSSSIPKAYQSRGTSPLKVTVKDGDNTFNLELK